MRQPQVSGWTRRRVLSFLLGAGAASGAVGKGQVLPSEKKRFLDPATEFEILRLTEPTYSSFLPAGGRSVSKRGDFLVCTSDREGTLQAFRIEIKTGAWKQLTDAPKFDADSLTLTPDDRSVCFFDGNRLLLSGVGSLREKELYKIPDGWERGEGFTVADDGTHAALIETKGGKARLVLVPMFKGEARVVVEHDGAMSLPMIRPRRAGILYRRDEAAWLVTFEGKDDHALKLPAGRIGPAMWTPDGRAVNYLFFPEAKNRLYELREYVPDNNTDTLVAKTSQFVQFTRNKDGSFFIGASGSKASPHILLLLRASKRELTLCEHKAVDPAHLHVCLSPNSTQLFYQTDKHGKPAIYMMNIDKLVEKTENEDET